MANIPPGKGTGCLPRTTRVGEGEFALYGSDGTPPLLTDRQLDALATTNGQMLLPYHWHTIDQASQSSCCASAGIGAVMLCEAVEGDEPEVLSQASVYAFDGVGSDGSLVVRRQDNGMNVEQCLRVLQLSGATGVEIIDQYAWSDYRRGRWPEDWTTAAAVHRVSEAWDCADLRACKSAIACGYPVVYGTDGHAVIGIGYDRRGLIILNSWGDDWGDEGIGRWPTHQIERYGAWAVRCTVPDDQPPEEIETNGGHST